MLKRLNRASSQLVANVSDYAIYTLDTNGRVTSWNLGAEKMILKGAALRIDPLHVLMAEPLRCVFAPLLSASHGCTSVGPEPAVRLVEVSCVMSPHVILSEVPTSVSRRGGRVVDGTGLENRHTRKGIGGSNPSLSASETARLKAVPE
jgi:hypothetical protein